MKHEETQYSEQQYKTLFRHNVSENIRKTRPCCLNTNELTVNFL